MLTCVQLFCTVPCSVLFRKTIRLTSRQRGDMKDYMFESEVTEDKNKRAEQERVGGRHTFEWVSWCVFVCASACTHMHRCVHAPF